MQKMDPDLKDATEQSESNPGRSLGDRMCTAFQAEWSHHESAPTSTPTSCGAEGNQFLTDNEK